MFASTSEHRLPDFMREGGGKVTAGQFARIVDIPADAGHDLQIFETLPKSKGRQLTPEKYLQRINRACETCYGVAGREYLKRLVKELSSDREALLRSLRKDMDYFETKIADDPTVDPRIRRRFALLYAAGQLGLRYKILPSRCDGFERAISACYGDAVGLSGRTSDTKAIETLNGFLRDNQERLPRVGPDRPLTTKKYDRAFGVRPPTDASGKFLWLKTSALHELYPGNYENVARLLGAAGIIRTDKKGHLTRQQRLPGLHGRREYVYVIDRDRLGHSTSSSTPNRSPMPD